MPPPAPHILVVVLDAVRAENLSVYGYERRTTPQLERWADRLTLYGQGISAATWTMPSTASLFTGTYPSRHRLVVDGEQLSPELVSLPELLRERGYHTAKLGGEVPYVSEFSGLDRGFGENYEARLSLWMRLRRALAGSRSDSSFLPGREEVDLEQQKNGHEEPRAAAKRQRAWNFSSQHDDGAAKCFQRVRQLWSRAQERPLFAYVHLMETHAEYRPPGEFRSHFVPRHLRDRDFSAVNQRPNLHAVGLATMSADDFGILRGLYDGAIAYVDDLLGGLFDDLSHMPGWEDTLVLVTADHGDCVGRHGILGHQFVCYEELIHVPWIVKWPGSVGVTGVRDELIQNVDLLPMICALLGIERPPQVEGVDFLNERREYAYSELLKPFGATAVQQGLHQRLPQYDRGVLAVRTKTHKWIAYTDGRDELFDLRNDPMEERDLLTSDRDLFGDGAVESLGREVQRWRPRFEEAVREVRGRLFSEEEAPIDAQVESKLKALGYID